MRKMALPVAFAVVAALAATSAIAQQPQTVRVRGTIASVDGSTLVIKPDDRPGRNGEARR